MFLRAARPWNLISMGPLLSSRLWVVPLSITLGTISRDFRRREDSIQAYSACQAWPERCLIINPLLRANSLTTTNSDSQQVLRAVLQCIKLRSFLASLQ